MRRSFVLQVLRNFRLLNDLQVEGATQSAAGALNESKGYGPVVNVFSALGVTTCSADVRMNQTHALSPASAPLRLSAKRPSHPVCGSVRTFLASKERRVAGLLGELPRCSESLQVLDWDQRVQPYGPLLRAGTLPATQRCRSWLSHRV